MNQVLKEKLASLPALPGCYLMKNEFDEIIYVGKAKRLSVRVNSYFNRPHSGKTQKLVSEIVNFDIIITKTEKEALILEMNLIHLHNPRYNILLKDGKSYPYVKISLSEDPTVSISRMKKDKKAKYFGPFPNSGAAREIVNLINRLYPLRKCNHIPSKPCLYYHIGQCIGPCVEKVSKEKYDEIVKEIVAFLNGDTKKIKSEITKKMYEYSASLEFEQAKECKDLLDAIEHTTAKQIVEMNDKIDRDIFAYHAKNDYISFSVLMIRSGLLLVKHTDVLPLYDDEESAFISYVMQFYQSHILPKEIIVSKIEDSSLLEDVLNVHVTIPSRGVKQELLKMSAENAIKAMEDKFLLPKGDDDIQIVLDELALRANIPSTHHIEMIDNSHLQGDDAVSAVVVFTNGVPNKKLYRKYNIKNDEKRDDTASMYEVIYRRFYRKLVEQTPYGDLLIVDGGITQINAARKALNELCIDLPIIGLAKDNKHTTRALVLENGEEVDIKDYPPLFFLLTKMQDEVHRFVISYHRDKRSKSMTSSLLDEIPGLGPKRKNDLLRVFGTISRIKEASIEELTQYVPKVVAENIKKTLV